MSSVFIRKIWIVDVEHCSTYRRCFSKVVTHAFCFNTALLNKQPEDFFRIVLSMLQHWLQNITVLATTVQHVIIVMLVLNLICMAKSVWSFDDNWYVNNVCLIFTHVLSLALLKKDECWLGRVAGYDHCYFLSILSSYIRCRYYVNRSLWCISTCTCRLLVSLYITIIYCTLRQLDYIAKCTYLNHWVGIDMKVNKETI